MMGAGVETTMAGRAGLTQMGRIAASATLAAPWNP